MFKQTMSRIMTIGNVTEKQAVPAPVLRGVGTRSRRKSPGDDGSATIVLLVERPEDRAQRLRGRMGLVEERRLASGHAVLAFAPTFNFGNPHSLRPPHVTE